jgi:hypothetical protein
VAGFDSVEMARLEMTRFETYGAAAAKKIIIYKLDTRQKSCQLNLVVAIVEFALSCKFGRIKLRPL